MCSWPAISCRDNAKVPVCRDLWSVGDSNPGLRLAKLYAALRSAPEWAGITPRERPARGRRKAPTAPGDSRSRRTKSLRAGRDPCLSCKQIPADPRAIDSSAQCDGWAVLGGDFESEGRLLVSNQEVEPASATSSRVGVLAGLRARWAIRGIHWICETNTAARGRDVVIICHARFGRPRLGCATGVRL